MGPFFAHAGPSACTIFYMYWHKRVTTIVTTFSQQLQPQSRAVNLCIVVNLLLAEVDSADTPCSNTDSLVRV
jgi:hypothetical protein